MSWIGESVMHKKQQFITDALRKQESFATICEKYNISRRVGYKYVHRFLRNGVPGLAELSRRPDKSPNQLNEDMICKIIRIKTMKKSWGPKKIRDIFKNEYPLSYLPSVSTFERVLKKAGLTEPRKRFRNKSGIRIVSRCFADAPNDIWTVDFKGYWYTTKKGRINPLTVRDEHSKYILAIVALKKADVFHVKQVFIELFKKHGLPKIIKSDNGVPFANVKNSMGLTKLSVWWMSLGIGLHRIKPASPYQNGAHERMHKDMAVELESLELSSIGSYQHEFDNWRNEFNNERPHEALGMKKPVELYRNSPRTYLDTTEDFTYPVDYYMRRVASRGTINFNSKRYFIGNPFYKYLIGIRPRSECLQVYFGTSLLGYLNKDTLGLVRKIMEIE